MAWYAPSAIEYKCGGTSFFFLPRYILIIFMVYTGKRLYGLTVTQKRPE
jgi:hypothetical protein